MTYESPPKNWPYRAGSNGAISKSSILQIWRLPDPSSTRVWDSRLPFWCILVTSNLGGAANEEKIENSFIVNIYTIDNHIQQLTLSKYTRLVSSIHWLVIDNSRPGALFCFTMDVVSSLFNQFEKFCLKSGVSVPSFTLVTLVQLG